MVGVQLDPKTTQMTSVAVTSISSAALTYAVVRWVLKLPSPWWRPALFSLLIEAATHYKDGKIMVQSKTMKAAAEAYALPANLGWYVFGDEGGLTMRDPAMFGRESGFYQAAVSGFITAVVWYVAARGFFRANNKQAMWYAGVFGIIGAYGGYLQGDQADGRKVGVYGIRGPFGSGIAPKTA